MNIFVSVGSTSTPQQEEFVRAVEDRLRAEGLTPQTVGRTVFSSDSPLTAVRALMEQCQGVVVIALERLYVESGAEKRGGAAQASLSDMKIATPWNQIEAALGYSKRLPLLVLVEDGVRNDGLLEKGLDWYVQTVSLDHTSLTTQTFNGVLAAWKQKLGKNSVSTENIPTPKPGDMTVAQLLGALKPTQLWSVLTSIALALAGSFALGAKLIP